MNILLYLTYAMVGIIEPTMWMKVLGKYFPKRYSNKWYYFLGGFGLYSIFNIRHMISFCIENDSINSISMILQIIYIFMLVKILYECKFVERLISIGLLVVVSMLIDTIAMVGWITFSRKDLDVMLEFGIINISITLGARLFEMLVLWMHISDKSKRIIKGVEQYKEVIPLIVLNFILSIPSWLIYNNLDLINNNIRFMQVIQMGTIMLFTILTFYIVTIINKRKRREINHLLKMEQMSMELEMYSEISELTEKLRSLRHDMKGHLGLIKGLFDSGEYDKLGEYLKKVYKDVELTDDIVLVNNKMVSILLSQKCKVARQNNITISPKVMIQDFRMEDVDICSVLSNILDNAIEAAQKQEEGYIDLLIAEKEQGYSIRCENSFLETPVMHKNNYRTTKVDSANHGLGIGIIRSIAAKYGGVAKIYHSADIFTVEVFIPNVIEGVG